jgi:hypothetical protein
MNSAAPLSVRLLYFALLFTLATAPDAIAAPKPNSSGSEVRYLKSDQALRKEANPGSLVVITLQKGAEVKLLKSAGPFAQVEGKSGAKGYILNLLLSTTPVAGLTPADEQATLSPAQQSRMRHRSTAATMGVRGLSADKALRKKFPPDLEALKTVESCEAPKEMLDTLAMELPL